MTLAELHAEANHLRAQRDAILNRIERYLAKTLGHPDAVRLTDRQRFELLPPINIALNRITARIEQIESALNPPRIVNAPLPYYDLGHAA